MNRLYPAEDQAERRCMCTSFRPKQVGVFPCRGWVAPCQRAASSIERHRVGVNCAEARRCRPRPTREGLPHRRQGCSDAADDSDPSDRSSALTAPRATSQVVKRQPVAFAGGR